MEAELRANLLSCAAAYATAEGIKLSTLGKRIGQDAAFFDRIADESKGFTTRVYTRSIQWFSDNWASDLAWPSAVQRPDAKVAA